MPLYTVYDFGEPLFFGIDNGLLLTIVFIAAVMGAIQGTCAYLILLERKISAWMQDRVGPNRAGPLGLLQPIADGLKFLLKEEIVPGGVDKVFYFLAPAIAVGTATLAIAVVPFGRTTPAPVLIDHRIDSPTAGMEVWPQTKAEEQAVLAADAVWATENQRKSYTEELKEYNGTIQFVIAPHVDIGIVFVFAVGSLAVYGIVLGGWSSNNKYSMLGGLRSSAQLISYEIPMGMSVLGIMLVTGSLNLEKIIHFQVDHGWNLLFQPLAALLFATAIFAECNRLPFDLPECESELVGGYHTEYSSMKFALFFLGEYTHMVTTSFLFAVLFLGGWHLPWVTPVEAGGIADWVIKLLVLGGKMIAFICFYMFIRWTIPRFRFDQLMGLAWKTMLPLALLSVVLVAVVLHFGRSPLWMSVGSVVILIAAGLIALRLPKPPQRIRVPYRGHGSAQPAVLPR